MLKIYVFYRSRECSKHARDMLSPRGSSLWVRVSHTDTDTAAQKWGGVMGASRFVHKNAQDFGRNAQDGGGFFGIVFFLL